jgi:RNA polymerase sigma-70 factor, ECF subfamily
MALRKLTESQITRFERLAWPCLPMLMRAAMCLTHRFHEAEDLVQETMIKAVRAIDRFKEGTDVKAWLLTIQRRAFIDRYRAARNERGQHSLDDEATPEPAAADTAEVGELDEHWDQPEQLLDRFDDDQVIEALRSLPQEIRWTLLLVDVQEMDQAEAAQVLGVPVGTIKSRAHRGRAMLRDKLWALARQRGWVAAKPEDDQP